MVFQKLLEYAEKIAVVGGVLVAVLTFWSQTRQVRINNSYLLLDAFTKDITQADLILLESVQLNTYESSGAQHGCFVVFNGTKREQHPISNLFITEGRGLVVHGSLESLLRGQQAEIAKQCQMSHDYSLARFEALQSS